jgi:O-acetyl-ADP-ribose deacetylase
VLVECVVGDITRQPGIDAIVNAANERLAPGSGVCGAIHRAGGGVIAQECAGIGHCATGDAVATSAGALPNRFVIHAVGPVWRGGGDGEEALLASCHRRLVAVASERGCHSIAVPAISTGVYGYPPQRAAPVAVAATLTEAARAGLALVRFVLFSDEHQAVYARAAGDFADDAALG